MDEKEEELKANRPPSHIPTSELPPGAKRLRVQFDITYLGTKGKTSTGASETEPDMTLTIGQLLERHTIGDNIPHKQPVFFEMEVPTFSDLTDIEEYRTQLAQRVSEVNKFIEDEKQQAAADKAARRHAASAAQKASKNTQQQVPIQGNSRPSDTGAQTTNPLD